MGSSDELAKIEACCKAFYGEYYEDQRRAHDVLLPLVSDPLCVPQLQLILANSREPAALVFAASGLLKLFTGHWNRITEQQKNDTRKFLLNYIYNNGPALLQNSPALLQNLIRLLARITKLGWLEILNYQCITEEVAQFLQASTAHFVIGMCIYTIITEDMQPQGVARFPRFRRTAISFRETALTEIVQTAIQTLQQINSNTIPFENPTEGRLLLKQLLQLALNCFSFEFSGTMSDESTDDQTTVMIPYTWYSFAQDKLPTLFFSLYQKCWNELPARPDCGRLCLQSLVLISAFRRTYFQKDEDRRSHLTQLIEGTATIIENKIGIQDDSCYHELCRLLGRINAANQLLELSQSSVFQIWIENVFKFTICSLENWSHLPNSKHYLVWMWANLVQPLLCLRDKEPPNVSMYLKKVLEVYIDSRMLVAEAVAHSNEDNTDIDFEDPLSNEVMRTEQLEVISSLARFDYQKTCRRVMKLLEEAHGAVLAQKISSEMFQQKATWLVYLIAVLMSINPEKRMGISTFIASDSTYSHLLSSSMDETSEDENTSSLKIINELASITFGFIRETDKSTTSPEGLELAYLYFLDQFRKIFINEHAKQFVQVPPTEVTLSVLGHTRAEAILNLVVEKLFYNLRARVSSEAIIKKTIQTFCDHVTGLSVVQAPTRLPHFIISGKLLLKSPLIQEALNNHQDPSFTFLCVPRYGRYRTLYYSTLTRLLLLDMKEEPDMQRWQSYMSVFATKFSELDRYALEGNFASIHVRETVINLARDLRGIVAAVISAEYYTMFFNWIVDKPDTDSSRIDHFIKAVEIWWDDHAVMTPLLKFMVDFSSNRSERICFNPNSPNGFYLFKVIAKVVQAYGQRILTKTKFDDVYTEKYKGVACVLEITSYAFNGNYVNFGIFKVYNDTVLENTLSLCLQLCLSIPEEDLQAYIKSLKTFYLFMDLVAASFMDMVIRIEPASLARLLRCLEDGLCSFENGVAIQSCGTLASIVQYLYTNQKDNQSVKLFLSAEHEALRRLLQLILQLLTTGEITAAWTMSTPLLGLILLNREGFVQIKEQMVMQLVPDRRLTLQGYFDDLMANVEDNLSAKNKETFSKNLYVFAQSMRSSLL